MHENKNKSKIKILKILLVWAKISKTFILENIYIWHSPVPGNIFHWDFPFFRLSLTALNFCGNGISSKFKKPVFIHIMTTFKTPKLSPETFSMGAYRTPKVGCFFQNCQNTPYLLLYYSAYKKATAMVSIWGDRGHPAICFEYKTDSERYLVGEL